MKQAYCAARIIDGVNDQPLLGQALIVQDGRVVGIAGPDEIGSDTVLTDLGDCTLMPGLIDSHVHLVDDGSPRPRGLVEAEPGGMTLLRAAQRAHDSLTSGVTSLRDMGAPSGIVPTLRDAIRAGVVNGPTILTCDAQLTITGGYGRRENVLGREVDGAEGMRRAVRRLFKDGADFVKLMASGQVSNAGAGVDACQFTQDEMNAAADEAHRLGRAVAVHAVGLRSIEACVAAGVDCIEHGNFMTEELAVTMAERGIFLVPTLLPYRVLSHPPEQLVLSEDVRKKALVAWEKVQEAVRMARAAGVQIGAGTDSGGPCIPHSSVSAEIALLAGAGLTPMEALRAATQTNARILRMPDAGTFGAGKVADVLVVEGNPLTDFAALEKVRLVLKAGRIVAAGAKRFQLPREGAEGRCLAEEGGFSCRC